MNAFDVCTSKTIFLSRQYDAQTLIDSQPDQTAHSDAVYVRDERHCELNSFSRKTERP